MNELKKKVNTEFKEMVNDLKNAVKEAEKNGEGLDVTELWGRTADHFANLDQHFLDFQERMGKTKKRMW